MAQQLINRGAAANDDTGDGLRTAFGKINDNFTELYAGVAGGTAALTDLYVHPTVGADTNAGTVGAPFATVAAAYTYAKTLSPSAANPISIHLPARAISSAAFTMDTAFIHLVGEPGSRLNFATGGITMTAANSSITGVQIVATGSNTGPLITTSSVVSQATYLENLILRDCDVTNTNASGVAIGRWSGDAYHCRITGVTAMQLLFGGRLFDCYLKGTSKVIEKSVSNADPGDDTTRRVATISGGTLEGTGVDCQVFGGLTEQETDFQRDGTTWWCTQLNGVTIWGPIAVANSVGASCYTMRGTFIANGCTIYGANTLYQVHDGYINGCYIVQTATASNAFFMNGGRSFQIVSSTLIAGFTHNAAQFSDNFHCSITNCTIENDGLDKLKHSQHFTHGLLWLNDPVAPRQIDYRSRGIAARFTPDDLTHFEIASSSSFALATITIEFWFKINTNGSGFYAAIGGNGAGTATGWQVFFQGSTDTVGVQHGAQYTQTTSATAFNGSAHHLAFCATGAGSTELYLDGTRIATGTAGAPSGDTKLAIGANATGASTRDNYFQGDVWEIRISSTRRYTGASISGGHPRRMILDANTVALFPSYTEKPYTWNDATGRFDALMPALSQSIIGLTSAANPYWVPIERALP